MSPDSSNNTQSPNRESRDPYAALRVSSYRRFALGNVLSTLANQMTAVAIGWELYEHTDSATALGLVGLVQFLPLLLLSIPAGHVADIMSRKLLIIISQIALAISGAALGLASLFHSQIGTNVLTDSANHFCAWLAALLGESGSHFTGGYVPLMFLLILVNGAVRAFNQPAKSALLPQIVAPSVFGNAVTWNSSIFEVSSMAGPALAGLLIALLHDTASQWSYPAVYLLNALFQAGQAIALVPVIVSRREIQKEPMTLESLSAGVRFVLQKRILFATMALDFFAVIFGGAVALLPIYARDILHVGPSGLGWLRAAPSIGAFAMAFLTAHLPPARRPGVLLLWAVAGFGVATIVFGVSTSFPLSLAMLFLTGAFDNVSVVVRQTLVQVLTPDSMRGRVSSVNAIFFGSANQLGAFESGVTAAMFGAVGSVVLGGIGTILVVLGAARISPEIRSLGRLDLAHESEEQANAETAS